MIRPIHYVVAMSMQIVFILYKSATEAMTEEICAVFTQWPMKVNVIEASND